MTTLQRLLPVLLLAATPAASLVFEVDRVDDIASNFGCDPAVPVDCSLRTALTLANGSPGPDEILLPSGTYSLEEAEGSLTFVGELVITGVPGDRPLIKKDFDDGEALLRVSGSDASFEMRHVDVEGYGESGGVLQFSNAGTVVELESVSVRRLGSFSHRAIWFGGPATMTDVQLFAQYGRTFVTGSDLVTIERSELIGSVYTNGPLSMKSTTVSWSTSVSNPLMGALQLRLGDILIEDCHIESSLSQQAIPVPGLLVDSSGDIVIRGTTIKNFIGTGGGGIEVQRAGSLTIEDSLIEGNTAGQGGGLLLTRTFSTLEPYVTTIRGTTFSGNEAPGAGGQGGAIHVGEDLELIVHNSTFTGNAARFGGGLWLTSGSQASLVHVTMSEQVSTAGSALSSLGSVEIQSSLVDGTCSGSGSRTSLGSNLESPGNTCGFSLPSDRPNVVDPSLASLSGNGGPTPTRVPQVGSPARDFATCALALDQRGAPRPFDGGGGLLCDAGAVEAGSPPPDWVFSDGFESGDSGAWHHAQ